MNRTKYTVVFAAAVALGLLMAEVAACADGQPKDNVAWNDGAPLARFRHRGGKFWARWGASAATSFSHPNTMLVLDWRPNSQFRYVIFTAPQRPLFRKTNRQFSKRAVSKRLICVPCQVIKRTITAIHMTMITGTITITHMIIPMIMITAMAMTTITIIKTQILSAVV